MLSLPNELFVHKIGKYLPVEDISNLQNTHFSINKIFLSDIFWQNRLIDEYSEMIEGKPNTISFRKYFKQVKLGIIRKIIDKYNDIGWYFGNSLHRENGPAKIFVDGSKFWYLNGKLHRTDGPAVERADGQKSWYLNGRHHRKNGPAVVYPDGSEDWCVNGEYHRENGPAIVSSNGKKFWFLNGKRHREDGPAVERANGDKEWWVNGKYLRTNGPAIESPDVEVNNGI